MQRSELDDSDDDKGDDEDDDDKKDLVILEARFICCRPGFQQIAKVVNMTLVGCQGTSHYQSTSRIYVPNQFGEPIKPAMGQKLI